MLKTTYIYGLADPRNENEVRYVGQSIQPYIRLSYHVSRARRHNSNSKLALWIQSLLEDGYQPIVRILEETTRLKSVEHETWWIERLHQEGVDVLNERRPFKPRYQTEEENETDDVLMISLTAKEATALLRLIKMNCFDAQGQLRDRNSKIDWRRITIRLKAYWD